MSNTTQTSRSNVRRIYISGPITSIGEERANEIFRQAERYIIDYLAFEPVNLITFPHSHGRSWGEYMRERIAAMLTCEAVFVLPGTCASKGALLELEVAKACGIPAFDDMELLMAHFHPTYFGNPPKFTI